MMIRPVLALAALGAALAIAGAGPGLAAGSTAKAFARGGAFCFALGGQAEGEFQHMKLVAERATGPSPFNVIPVHGVERGTWKGKIYENTFTGTATVAPPAGGSGMALHFTLNGGGNSIRPDGSPEMWLLQYAAELKADTLAGSIAGYEMETGAIANGKPFTTDAMNFVQKDVTPMDCAKF